jgi:hypothetical protein
MQVAGTTQAIQRPDVPYDLTDDEGAVWRSVVDAEAADWFRPSQLPMLTQYCRHVVSSRKIAGMVRALEDEVTKAAEAAETSKVSAILGAMKAIDRLLKMQDRESRAIASLATKMRIAQQSTYDKSKKKPTLAKRPWDQ